MPVVGARGDEDEKRKKLQQVIDILKVSGNVYARKGRAIANVAVEIGE
jgi:hypothetical protein